MSYALATLFHERQRFLPGILAVAFSAVLSCLQCGMLLGLFSITSIPIDHSRADVWVSALQVHSVDLGRPLPNYYIWRVANQPEVTYVEPFIQGFAYWSRPTGGEELCTIIGSRLEEDAMGAVVDLTPELRRRLGEPNTVVVDESEMSRLGITGVGDHAEVAGHRVRVVGLVSGMKSIAGPYLFCSLYTARPFLRFPGEYAVYYLARCKNPADAPQVVQRLRRYPTMSAYTSEEFSLGSQLHWLTKTKAGIALGYAALLGLLVGAVVTSQTLYAATVASLKEYAVLRALGIPRWRMALTVLTQSFWVGVVGLLVAIPSVYGLAWLAESVGAKVILPPWLLAGTAAVTMVMALLAGLAALRSLRLVEPIALLR